MSFFGLVKQSPFTAVGRSADFNITVIFDHKLQARIFGNTDPQPTRQWVCAFYNKEHQIMYSRGGNFVGHIVVDFCTKAGEMATDITREKYVFAGIVITTYDNLGTNATIQLLGTSFVINSGKETIYDMDDIFACTAPFHDATKDAMYARDADRGSKGGIYSPWYAGTISKRTLLRIHRSLVDGTNPGQKGWFLNHCFRVGRVVQGAESGGMMSVLLAAPIKDPVHGIY
jgi:hypothetical protein